MTNPTLPTDEGEILALAGDPASSPEQLAAIASYLELVSEPDFERPTSGAEFLRFLGRQGPLAVFLERNPQAPIVAALVANPNTPQQTLLRFAADFPEEFLGNPALLLLLLEHPDLFRPMDEQRLLMFLRHADIPADLLGTIRGYAPPAVAEAIQHHVSMAGEAGADWAERAAAELPRLLPLPPIDGQQYLIEHRALGTLPPWLERLVQESTLEHIRQAVHDEAAVLEQAAPGMPSFVINSATFDPAAIGQSDRETRLRAAESGDPALLRLLADDDDAGVRARVARNPNTPPESMRLLEQDDSQRVRAALAANPGTPAELLDRLARDYSFSAQWMRQAIARHPSVTPETLERLATDELIQVRNEVARNPRTTAQARRQLLDRALTMALYSNDQFFHLVAMANEHTDPTHLAKGVRSPFWRARYALAGNPAAPPEALRALAEDGNCFVRAAGRHALDQRLA